MKSIILFLFLFIPIFIFAQTQKQIDAFFGTASGTNSYSVTISAIKDLLPYNGQKINVQFANANSGVSTLKVNNFIAKDVVDKNGSALTSGFISANGIFTLVFNLALDKWQVLGDGSTAGGGSGTVTSVGIASVNGFTASGSPVTTSGTFTLSTDAARFASAPLSLSTNTLSISQSGTSTNGWLSSTNWNTFNNKQDALVSGTNIKTINGSSILGSGNLSISGGAGTVTSVNVGNNLSITAGSYTLNPTLNLAATPTVTGIKITGGSPGTGKVLQSDASGNGSWQTVSGAATTTLTAGANITLNGTAPSYTISSSGGGGNLYYSNTSYSQTDITRTLIGVSTSFNYWTTWSTAGDKLEGDLLFYGGSSNSESNAPKYIRIYSNPGQISKQIFIIPAAFNLDLWLTIHIEIKYMGSGNSLITATPSTVALGGKTKYQILINHGASNLSFEADAYTYVVGSPIAFYYCDFKRFPKP